MSGKVEGGLACTCCLEDELFFSLASCEELLLQEAVKDKTETISLPFWIDFEQWMVSVTPPTHTPKNIVGQICILIYEANNFLRSQPIASEGLLFGRSSECEVVLESSMISAKHFQIVKVRERYFITDLYSKNGTYLNGRRLNPHAEETLNHGDVIALGKLKIQVLLRNI